MRRNIPNPLAGNITVRLSRKLSTNSRPVRIPILHSPTVLPIQARVSGKVIQFYTLQHRLGPGDGILAEDLTGKGHTTRAVGNDTRVVVIPLAG
jgi:hypothetical protein